MPVLTTRTLTPALALVLLFNGAACSDDVSTASPAATSDVNGDGADASDAAGEGGDAGLDVIDAGEEDVLDPTEWSADPFPTGEIGGDRPAEIVLPTDDSPDRRWPVVTLLHGFTASALVQDTYFGVSTLADELGIIVVLPDGMTNSQGAQFWNATDWCCDFERTGVDDAGYLIGLLDEIEEFIPVDPSRVVFIGHSNGGFMSYHLACDYADRVTAIVSLAGLEWIGAARCNPVAPVTVLQIHGTNDETVAFDDDPLLPSARDTAARWVERNDCLVEPETSNFDFESRLPADETVTETWSDCDRGTSVGLWVIPDGSHIPTLRAGAIRSALEFALDRPREEP